MDDVDKIKAKIKKLLSLSRSPNPNEAASALKKAQELLAEYGLGQHDVNAIDIGETSVSTAYRNNVPRYEARLFGYLSTAFGCEVIHYQGKSCTWRLIGLQHRAEVAAYIGQVLLRKLRSARTGYIKSLHRVRSRSRKTQRADAYCLAWVTTVTAKLPAFTGISAEEEKAVALYKDKAHPLLTKLNLIKRPSVNSTDYRNGARAGEGVQLQHGVGVHSPGSLLLEA